MKQDKRMEKLIRDRSNEQNTVNTFRLNKPIGFFGVKPVRRQPAGTSADRVLNKFGLLSDGEVKDQYFGTWTLTGAGSTLPDGWAISWSSSAQGDYTLTHNLNNLNYHMFITPQGGSPKLYTVTKSLNTVLVKFENDTGSPSGTSASFLLINIT